MKRICLISIFVVACGLRALSESTSYSVRYLKEHLFYKDGDYLNVIDVDLEWPEVVDGADMSPFNAYVSKRLFGIQGNNLDTLYAHFIRSFGEPVKEKFASLPDDRRFCYIDLSMKMVSHMANRFVSFEITCSCKPGKLSKYAAQSMSQLLTYDLESLQVLFRNDLLRTGKMNAGIDSKLLYMPAYVGDSFTTFPIRDACLTEGGIMLKAVLLDDYGEAEENLVIESGEMAGYLSKEANRLLKQGKKAVGNKQKEVPDSWNGGRLLLHPEQMPAFAIEGRTLSEYLSTNIRVPKEMADDMQHGVVRVQFIVDADGRVQDVCVVKPLAPSYDREAARLIRSLPRWQPGSDGGSAVSVLMAVDVTF